MNKIFEEIFRSPRSGDGNSHIGSANSMIADALEGRAGVLLLRYANLSWDGTGQTLSPPSIPGRI